LEVEKTQLGCSRRVNQKNSLPFNVYDTRFIAVEMHWQTVSEQNVENHKQAIETTTVSERLHLNLS